MAVENFNLYHYQISAIVILLEGGVGWEQAEMGADWKAWWRGVPVTATQWHGGNAWPHALTACFLPVSPG
jgi:hypothetical protein